MRDSELLYRVALMYYVEDMTQAEIAKAIGISRPKVSRLLKRARDEGIVRIEISPPGNESVDLIAKELRRVFGLDDVVVADVDSSDEKEILRAISRVGARYLEKNLRDHTVVGIGWGRTVYSAVNEILPVRRLASSVFVPLIGGAGQSERFYQINSIVEKLADKFGAEHVYLNAPAFFDDRSTLEAFMREKRISEVLKMWKQLDTVVFGLGKPIQDSEILRSEMDPSLVLELIREKAIGDILARFFKPDGELCKAKLNDLILGIDLETLFEVPQRICLCGGIKKAEGIKTAAFRRYFNVLITDSKTAGVILSSLKGGGAS